MWGNMPEALCRGPPLFRSGRLAQFRPQQRDVSKRFWGEQNFPKMMMIIFFNDVAKHTA